MKPKTAKEARQILEEELLTIKAEYGQVVLTAETFAKVLVEMAGGAGPIFEAVIVQTLPRPGENGKVYLIKNGEEHDEYLWIESLEDYELIGSTKVEDEVEKL